MSLYSCSLKRTLKKCQFCTKFGCTVFGIWRMWWVLKLNKGDRLSSCCSNSKTCFSLFMCPNMYFYCCQSWKKSQMWLILIIQYIKSFVGFTFMTVTCIEWFHTTWKLVLKYLIQSWGKVKVCKLIFIVGVWTPVNTSLVLIVPVAKLNVNKLRLPIRILLLLWLCYYWSLFQWKVLQEGKVFVLFEIIIFYIPLFFIYLFQ